MAIDRSGPRRVHRSTHGGTVSDGEPAVRLVAPADRIGPVDPGGGNADVHLVAADDDGPSGQYIDFRRHYVDDHGAHIYDRACNYCTDLYVIADDPAADHLDNRAFAFNYLSTVWDALLRRLPGWAGGLRDQVRLRDVRRLGLR